MVYLQLTLLLLGLILLVKGSDYFVKAASSIAKKFGVSDFVIGLTLVAFGTSVPELASSIVASLENASGLIIGNVIGSNIANIGLIIGLAASFAIIKTQEDMLKRDGYIMLFASLLFFFFAFNGIISRTESIVFLIMYFVYILFLFQMKPSLKKKYHFKDYLHYLLKFKYLHIIKDIFHYKNNQKENKNLSKSQLIKDLFVLILGLFAIIFGAKFLIEQSIFFASLLKVPQNVIGLSFIAIGTSLPELSVSITATKKGYGNIALGNIIGSNIANILFILGVSGFISPLTITQPTIYFTLPFMIFMGLLLLLFIKSRWQIRKFESFTLLLLYLLFMLLLFFGFMA